MLIQKVKDGNFRNNFRSFERAASLNRSVFGDRSIGSNSHKIYKAILIGWIWLKFNGPRDWGKWLIDLFFKAHKI